MSNDSPGTQVQVCLCLGSSCYARGNRDNLERMQEAMEEGEMDHIALEGCHCTGNCRKGPNITIDGDVIHEMTPEVFETVVDELVSRGDAL